jgi:hypothetical protein
MNNFDYEVFVNTIAKDAQSNYDKNLSNWYNTKMRFTNPKFNKGYFAVIKAIANGINKSRRDIVKYIHNDVAFHRGWYSDVFYRLKASEIISYSKNEGYTLTKFGNRYYTYVMNSFNVI